MDTFNYLKKEGDSYSLNFKAGNTYLGIGFCIAFSVFIVIQWMRGEASGLATILFVAIFGGLAAMIIMRRNHKIIFNPANKTITFPQLRNKEGRILNFDQFLNFRVVKIKQNGLITVGTQLQMEFDIQGKDKAFLIRHYMFSSTKEMEQLANEIEQVMSVSHHEILK